LARSRVCNNLLGSFVHIRILGLGAGDGKDRIRGECRIFGLIVAEGLEDFGRDRREVVDCDGNSFR